MTIISVIRHGQTDWNKEGRLQGRENILLNETGLAQSRECAEAIAAGKIKWDIAFCSPLDRAKQTSDIITEKIGIAPAVKIAEFIERDYGETSGLMPNERHSKFPGGVDTARGVEPYEAAAGRFINKMKELGELYPEKHILIVAHGGIINAVTTVLTDGEYGIGKTYTVNCCINVFEYEGGILNFARNKEKPAYNMTGDEYVQFSKCIIHNS